jgi:hypothetical protein
MIERSDDEYRHMARQDYATDGLILIPDNASVNRNSDGAGAWIRALVFVGEDRFPYPAEALASRKAPVETTAERMSRLAQALADVASRDEFAPADVDGTA